MIQIDYDKTGVTGDSTVNNQVGYYINLADGATNHSGSTVGLTAFKGIVDFANSQGTTSATGMVLEVIDAATKIMEKFKKEFYKIQDKWKNDSKKTIKNVEEGTEESVEDNLQARRPEFDQDLIFLGESFIRSLNRAVKQYGEGVREVFTMFVMSGIKEMRNINQYPILRSLIERDDTNPNTYLLNPVVYLKWNQLWEELFFKRDADNVLVSTKYKEIGSKMHVKTIIGNALYQKRQEKYNKC